MTREKQIWFWLISLTVVLGGLFLLRGVLLPFVAGLGVAYFLDPLADRLEALLKSRTAATAVILLTFFAVVIITGIALFPLLQAQVMGLVARLPEAVTAAHELLGPIVARIEAELGADEIQKLKDNASSMATSTVSWLIEVLQSLFMGGKAVVNTLSLFFITPVVAFFLLRDWDVLVAKVDSLLPRKSADTIREQFRNIDTTIAGFVRGQAMVCLCLGAMFATGLTLVGLEFGLLIGLATGLMAFVPYVGMVIGLVVAFGVALLQFTDVVDFLLVGAVFAVGQSIDAALLTPNLVGGRVGLHPVWIIFALMAGGALFGFAGVLLAVPMAAVIGVLVRFAIGRYRDSYLYTGS